MQKKKMKIAVLGATGNVGRTLLQILNERGFHASQITAIASQHSAGGEISYGDEHTLRVHALESFAFHGMDVVLSSLDGALTQTVAPRITSAGAILIDNSSAFRMEKNIPLVIPEVNPEDIKLADKKIIASPNCSMIALAVALKPLDNLVKISRVVVSTYQSVSGAGKGAMDELYNQTRAIYMNTSVKAEYLPKPIAFNIIPHIDDIEDSGDTGEEIKIISEFQKVMHRAIPTTATAVRVPVFIGHCASVNITFDSEITVAQAQSCLKNAPGVRLLSNFETYSTPTEVTGEDAVFISRLRHDSSTRHGLNLWIAFDNLRKGAALNVVQILELLIK